MEELLAIEEESDNVVYNIKPLYIYQIDSQYSQSSSESSHGCSHGLADGDGDAQIEDQIILEEKFEDSFQEDESVILETPMQKRDAY